MLLIQSLECYHPSLIFACKAAQGAQSKVLCGPPSLPSKIRLGRKGFIDINMIAH